MDRQCRETVTVTDSVDRQCRETVTVTDSVDVSGPSVSSNQATAVFLPTVLSELCVLSSSMTSAQRCHRRTGPRGIWLIRSIARDSVLKAKNGRVAAVDTARACCCRVRTLTVFTFACVPFHVCSVLCRRLQASCLHMYSRVCVSVCCDNVRDLQSLVFYAIPSL